MNGTQTGTAPYPSSGTPPAGPMATNGLPFSRGRYCWCYPPPKGSRSWRSTGFSRCISRRNAAGRPRDAHVLARVWRLLQLVASGLPGTAARRVHGAATGTGVRWLLLTASPPAGPLLAVPTAHLAVPWTRFHGHVYLLGGWAVGAPPEGTRNLRSGSCTYRDWHCAGWSPGRRP